MPFKWSYEGVNSTITVNGGPKCARFVSPIRIVTEGIIVSLCCIYIIRWSWRNIKRKTLQLGQTNERILWGKHLLLVAMTFTFGIEIGFKFASRSVIFILNPCHIATMMQIYILAAGPSETITILFRVQMNFMNGPFLAFMFPETDSRQFFMEVVTYWVQHALMWIIPIYLLRLGGPYTMEPVGDFDFNCLSYASLVLYHFSFLQILSLPTQVNLNHMLCPAALDPFEGPWYRLAAIVHQGFLCPFLAKIGTVLFTPEAPRSSQLAKGSSYNQTLTSMEKESKLE